MTTKNPGKRGTRTRTEARAAETLADPRWAHLRARDLCADGAFFYAVETTGVYCRPSCGARTPRPENVSFHRTAAAAERAGYRACKRCKPGQASPAAEQAELVARLCRFIETRDNAPSLAELAGEAGLSTFHTHRLFKAATGLTPRAYAAAQRGSRVRSALKQRSSITAAIYEAGYQSSGRFYEKSGKLLGMTPRAFRAGGAGTQMRVAVEGCSLGKVLVAATDRGVCAILLGDRRDELLRELAARFPRAEQVRGDDIFAELVQKVVSLVEAPHRRVELPLDIRGTAFQQRVWAALTTIPAGKTLSYGELAEALGDARAVRAVASACAANALAVAVPCHRVVRADGSLSGYRWGVERKRALLAREGRD